MADALEHALAGPFVYTLKDTLDYTPEVRIWDTLRAKMRRTLRDAFSARSLQAAVCRVIAETARESRAVSKEA